MAQTERRSDVRARIIEEATRLFAEDGFNGTSIQAISEAVGIRRPSLIYHFGSKDELRREVLEGMLAHWKRDFPALLEAATTGEDRLEAGLAALIRFFRDDPARARLVIREMLDRPDAMRELFLRHLHPWTNLVTDYIRLGQSQGTVCADLDADAWVVQIVSMVISTVAAGGVAGAILHDNTLCDIDAQVHELLRIARVSLFVSGSTSPALGSDHG